MDRVSQLRMLVPPTDPKHLVTLEYVQGQLPGQTGAGVVAVDNQAGSYAAGVLTYAANGALVIDGVTLAVGDRVLLAGQSDAKQNGIYSVTVAGNAGTPAVVTRATAFNESSEFFYGLSVGVWSGTLRGTIWTLTTPDPITLDTSSLVFTQGSAPAVGGVRKKTFQITGNGTDDAWAFTHDWGTFDVQVAVYETATKADVGADIKRLSANAVQVSMGLAPALGENYTVVVVG